MRKLIVSCAVVLSGFASYGQDQVDLGEFDKWTYLPGALDSLTNGGCIPRRCKTVLSDSLSSLVDSFPDEAQSVSYDSTMNYTYQFTKTIDLTLDFRNRLEQHDSCFEIEENRKLEDLVIGSEFIRLDNDWLLVIVRGIPQIGNSTRWKDNYIYFKRN